MTSVTAPDYVVMCSLIYTHTHIEIPMRGLSYSVRLKAVPFPSQDGTLAVTPENILKVTCSESERTRELCEHSGAVPYDERGAQTPAQRWKRRKRHENVYYMLLIAALLLVVALLLILINVRYKAI